MNHSSELIYIEVAQSVEYGGAVLSLFTQFTSMLLLPHVAMAAPDAAPRGGTPRGILFFLADDMGQWAAEPYGNSEIITPTLTRLSKEGTTFTNAVCNTPVCSASRASLLTGRMPSQHGVHDWLSGGNGCAQRSVNFTDRRAFYTDAVLAEHGSFKALGLSGKYHLGIAQWHAMVSIGGVLFINQVVVHTLSLQWW